MINAHEKFDAMRRAADGNLDDILKAEEEEKIVDLKKHGFVPEDVRSDQSDREFGNESWIAKHEKRQEDYGDQFADQLGPDVDVKKTKK